MRYHNLWKKLRRWKLPSRKIISICGEFGNWRKIWLFGTWTMYKIVESFTSFLEQTNNSFFFQPLSINSFSLLYCTSNTTRLTVTTLHMGFLLNLEGTGHKYGQVLQEHTAKESSKGYLKIRRRVVKTLIYVNYLTKKVNLGQKEYSFQFLPPFQPCLYLSTSHLAFVAISFSKLY